MRIHKTFATILGVLFALLLAAVLYQSIQRVHLSVENRSTSAISDVRILEGRQDLVPVTSLGALAPSASVTTNLWTRSTEQPWWIEYRTDEDGQVHSSELDIYAGGSETITLNLVILEDRVESLDETEPAHTIGP